MNEKSEVGLRFYHSGDEDIIIALLKKTFPKWRAFPDAKKFWQWKYLHNPNKTTITIAEADGKLIGCNHSILFTAKIGSEITFIEYGDDLAVDEEYRGYGIWGRMRKFNDENQSVLIKYDYASSANPQVITSWKNRKQGILPYRITRMVKINDVELHLKMRPQKNLLVNPIIRLLKLANQTRNMFFTKSKPENDYQIIMVSAFEKNIDELWQKIHGNYQFLLEKNHIQLNWRFANVGKSNYTLFQAINGDVILGYMAVGVREEDGYKEGFVADLLALHGRDDVAEALLGQACSYFDQLGVNAVYYQVVEGHPYQNLSARWGFVNSHSYPYVKFTYTDLFMKNSGKTEVPFLKDLRAEQIHFGYSETL